MSYYKVVELFTSINGEGQRAGQIAVFVRFQGCNLHCSFCDTTWANEKNAKYQLMSEKEICDKIPQAFTMLHLLEESHCSKKISKNFLRCCFNNPHYLSKLKQMEASVSNHFYPYRENAQDSL